MKRTLLFSGSILAIIIAIAFVFTLRDSENTSQMNQFFSGLMGTSTEIETDPVSSDLSSPLLDRTSLMQYPSLDGSLVFILTSIVQAPDSADAVCQFEIRDKKSNLMDVTSLFEKQEVACSEGQTISSAFIGWAKGNILILKSSEPGVVDIIDITKRTKSVFTFDGLLYDFAAVSDDVSVWVLKRREIVEDKVHYTVVSQREETLAEFDIEGNDRGVLYDAINKGFLFISRDFGSTETDGYTPVSVRFDWFAVEALALRHILTTDRARAQGRGCTSEEIVSVSAGEIVLTPGCLIVNKKYLGSDGNIHISL